MDFATSHLRQLPQPCPKCGSLIGKVSPAPQNSPHYARLDCTCGRWVKWIAHPKNRQLDTDKLASDIAIAKCRATRWDNDFLINIETWIEGNRRLTPKQLTKASEVVGRYLEPSEREWTCPK